MTMFSLLRLISNDCDKCMCLWEDCTSNENGTEWDYGCNIKGCDFESKLCFIPGHRINRCI